MNWKKVLPTQWESSCKRYCIFKTGYFSTAVFRIYRDASPIGKCNRLLTAVAIASQHRLEHGGAIR